MSDTPTPRVHACLMKYGRYSLPSELVVGLKRLSRQLERELNEANEAVSAWQNESLQSRATIKLLSESTSELTELREWKADVEESHKRIMSERCPTDEVHCTCVPVLKAELTELKRQIREGELVFAENVIGWFSLEKPLTPKMHKMFTSELKQFAAERQGQ